MKKGRGPKRKLGLKQEEEIKLLLEKNPNISVSNIRNCIQEKYDIRVSISTVYRLIKRLNFSYITTRTKHYKSDSSKQEEFKKKWKK